MPTDGDDPGPNCEAAMRELNDLRLVFANISGYSQQVDLRTILKLPEIKAQTSEGDISVQDLESAWLEACALQRKDVSMSDQSTGDQSADDKSAHRRSWGVCTDLPFDGFLRFLSLCESRAPFPKGHDGSPETASSPTSAKTGHDLVTARHRMVGLIRATLTLHQRGGASEEEEEEHRSKNLKASLGETLHSTMVRAALEEGLAHHTPETLRELIRTGVYKGSKEEAQLEREQRKASLRQNLSRQISQDYLIRSGILKDGPNNDGPGRARSSSVDGVNRHSYRATEFGKEAKSGIAREGSDGGHPGIVGKDGKKPSMRALESPSSQKEWSRRAEIDNTKQMLEDMYGDETPSEGAGGSEGRKGQDHHPSTRRLSLEELKAKGIYRTPEEVQAEEEEHDQTRTFLQKELDQRADVGELEDKGIYLTRQDDSKQRLERSMMADQLSQHFRNRPYMEDLMDKGVLEAAQLKSAFEELEKKGPVKTMDGLLQWSVVASAIEKKVVSMERLRKAFDEAKTSGAEEGMSYEEFDHFLASTMTTQVDEEQMSLKLWTLMKMRPELEEQEHHESNRRRNAVIAQELESELSKREPLENLANKGIYLEKTPVEGATERAHLTHTLAHGLAHRSTLEELSHKGVYMENTTPVQHNLERQLIEQHLSRSLRDPMRPSKKDLVERGVYMEATPRELQMDHYLAARNLKHALEERETVQDLKEQGVYQAEDSQRAAHDKRLVKALLQKKLAHAFSSEEVGRLKQKGVYKEAEHDKLHAERLLITRQLVHLIGNRPDPAQLEREHPHLMQASTLALVFEERVMPRNSTTTTKAGETEGGKGDTGKDEAGDVEDDGETEEHYVSFEGLMTWSDVQEHLNDQGDHREEAKREMAAHFDLCDCDGDGYITFSQFLRWVELCDLNPEEQEATEAELDADYAQLAGGAGGVTFEQAASYRRVHVWAESASLDRKTLQSLWGEGDEVAIRHAEGFKAFCRLCESRFIAAKQERVEELQAEAAAEEADAKVNRRASLSRKLSARPDLEELKKARIYRSGGLDPATELLERNLIAISLKEHLLSRPALEDLEERGIKPKDDAKNELENNSSKLREALDSTMKHDDALWRVHPSLLGAGPREEVSALLQKSLSKRRSIQELTNKGIYVVDTDASYALLVHQVLQVHRGFLLSSAELAPRQ